jgi:hypothetical protein
MAIPFRALCLLGPVIAILAGLPTASPAAPVARFSARSIDAGQALAGDATPFAFTVWNDGDAPLTLEVRANCGCTTPRWDPHVAPGAQGKIETSLGTAGLVGRITKELEVLTNDPSMPRVVLSLVVDIRRAVEVLPSPFPVIALPDTGPARIDLTVRFVGHTARVQEAIAGSRYLQATVEPAAAPGEWLVHLAVDAEAPQGRTAAVVTLNTTSTRQPVVSIVAVLERGLCATPPSVFFSPVSPQDRSPVVREVTLTRASGSLERCRVASADRRITARIAVGRQGAPARLIVTYTGGALKRDLRTSILIDPGAGLRPLTIPVVAYAAPAE